MEDKAMSIVKFSNTLPTWFDQFIDNDKLGWFNHTVPSVNIKETDKEFMLELAVPGMKKDDFKIELHKDVLTISSEQKEEKDTKQDKEGYTRREFSYHSFARSFTLPENIDTKKIEAKYDNGILSLKLPKADEAKVNPRKQISIS